MNPFVRTAYDHRTLSWLGVTRRFEGLYSFLHNLGNHLVGLPVFDNDLQATTTTIAIIARNPVNDLERAATILRSIRILESIPILPILVI
jgi:hypothetical protein